MEKEEDAQIDIGVVPVVDLRALCQDEIRSVAKLFGDFTARLAEEVVEVAIDRSIFNESAGSRRQTYDRERNSSHSKSNKPRLSRNNTAAALASSAGLIPGASLTLRENRDLVLRLCRRLNIDEKLALEVVAAMPSPPPPPPPPPLLLPAPPFVLPPAIADSAIIRDQEGTGSYVVRSLKPNGLHHTGRLKRMARANGVDNAAPAIGNGALVPVEQAKVDVSFRSSKKMKTKEEARRRPLLAESSSGSQQLAIVARMDDVDIAVKAGVEVKVIDAQGFPSGWKVCVGVKKRGAGTSTSIIKFISPGGQEWSSYKEALAHAGSMSGMNASSQMQVGLTPNDSGHIIEQSQLVKSHDLYPVKWKRGGSLFCTCGRNFVNTYTLKRHAIKAGHPFTYKPSSLRRSGPKNGIVVQKLLKEVIRQQYLCGTCGKSYANNFTLRRHAASTGHVLPQANAKGKMLALPFDKSGDMKQESESVEHAMTGRTEGSRNWKRRNMKKIDSRMYLIKKSHKRGAKSYECRQCYRRFRKKSQIISHMDIHFLKHRMRLGRPVKVKDTVTGEYPKPDKEGKPMHRRGKRKREQEEEYADRPKKLFNDEVEAQGVSESGASFTCQECGNHFSNHLTYSSHLSLHRTTPSTEPSYEAAVSKHISSSSYNDGQDSCNEASLLNVGYRRLLSETTGTYLSSLPARLLFSGKMETLGLHKRKELRYNDKTSMCAPQDICATSSGNKVDGNLVTPSFEVGLVGWGKSGCQICVHNAHDTLQHLVCNWCDKDFHRNDSMQQCELILSKWVCPYCSKNLRT